MTDEYPYDKELTSSSLSSTSEQCGRTPKPPKKPRSESSNLYARQRIYKTYAETNTNHISFERTDSIDSNFHPNDEVIKILNTTSGLSSRLTKYSALPRITNKTHSSQGSYSPMSRPASVNSNFEFDYNDLYDDDANILIGLRLPDGSKKQKTFHCSTRLQTVLDFGLDKIDNYSDSLYSLLQLPSNVINDLDQTIKQANITNRSMLFIIDKKQCE